MLHVYVSPSTQENNQGVNGYGTEEYQMNRIADIVINTLARHGIATYRNDPKMNLSQIVNDSNSKPVDLHLAIHSNAGGGHGCEVFCWKKDGTASHKIGQIIYDDMAAITPGSDRGLKQAFNYYGTGVHMYEVAYTNAPAVLIEIAFHDNANDASWIMNNITLIGETLAKSILKYYSIAYIPVTPPTPTPTPTSEREKAIERMKQVSQWWDKYVAAFDGLQKNNLNVYGLINKLWDHK